MMYIHYCKNCQRLHMLNGHKIVCPSCDNDLTELNLPYLTYVEMNTLDRNLLLEQLTTEEGLQKLSTTYRMFKYSKWFKEQNLKVL